MVQKLYKILTLSLLICNCSCVYVFTNRTKNKNTKYTSIYIESPVGNQSSDIDHEKLTLELQRSLIERIPKIRLTSKKKAELFFRTIVNNSVLDQKSNTSSQKTNYSDTGKKYNPIEKFDNIKKATEFSSRENISLSLTVQIIDINKNKVLINKHLKYLDGYNFFENKKAGQSLFLASQYDRQKTLILLSQKFTNDCISLIKNLMY